MNARLHRLQLDVVQVIDGLHYLHQPVLGRVVVLGEDWRLRKAGEPGVGSWC